MHTIEPARLKPGVTVDSIPDASTSSGETHAPPHTIRGKALIFWDLNVPGNRKKLDAIDTDQITPASDCVAQSPDAVADARDQDEFSFDPESRRLTNETQHKAYDPIPLTPKEDEIRRTGGIFAAGRREVRASVATAAGIEWPDPERARRMT